MLFFTKTKLTAAVLGLSLMVPQLVIAGSDETPFTQQELQEFLIGKTYPLSKGAIYFEDSETMIAIWKGKTETTKWWATDDSSFCYNLKMFGAEECLGLLMKGDDRLIQIWKGQRRKLKRKDIKEGKTF
jgi:hypothetical protein